MSQRPRRAVRRIDYRQLNRSGRAPYDAISSDDEEKVIDEFHENAVEGVDSDEEDHLEIQHVVSDDEESELEDEGPEETQDAQSDSEDEIMNQVREIMADVPSSDESDIEDAPMAETDVLPSLTSRPSSRIPAVQPRVPGSSIRPPPRVPAPVQLNAPEPARRPRGRPRIRDPPADRQGRVQPRPRHRSLDRENPVLAPNGTEWSWQAPPATRPRVFNQFGLVPGPKGDARGVQTILESFNLLFNDAMVAEICARTNAYARLAQEVINVIRPRRFEWQDMDPVEFRAFIGLLLRAGLQKSSGLEFNDFWTTVAENRSPIFQAAMSRNRARLIMQFLRFDDVLERDPGRREAIRRRFVRYNRNPVAPADQVAAAVADPDFDAEVVADVEIPAIQEDIIVLNPEPDNLGEFELPDIDPVINPPRNRFIHIQSIFNQFVANCKAFFEPGPNITIDESLIPFKGRCPFRVYMKNKPHRYGIKVWAAVCSSTGYMYNLQVYQGAQHQGGPEIDQGTRVVMDMMDGYLNAGRGITCDNFFTTLNLADRLLAAGTTVVGTIRGQRREVPTNLRRSRGQEPHSSDFVYTPIAGIGHATLVRYVPKRNKNVLLLSTQHQGPDVSNVPGHNRKPEIILHYNRTKGGVDTTDQMVAHFTCQRGTRRWPIKVLMFILDVGALNAYRIWIGAQPDWFPDPVRRRRKFIFELTDALIRPLIQRRLAEPGLKSHVRSAMTILGFAVPVVAVLDPEGGARIAVNPRPCHFCQVRRNTRTVCSACGQAICKNHQFLTIMCPDCRAQDPQE